MIVLSDLVDGMCTVEERKKETLEIINYVSNNNFQTLEEHRKSIAPPPARAKPSLLPQPKTETQKKIYKAIDNAADNMTVGTKNHIKWFGRSALDGSLTLINIGSYLFKMWSDPIGCIRFWFYFIIAGTLIGLAGIKFLEMFCNFFG